MLHKRFRVGPLAAVLAAALVFAACGDGGTTTIAPDDVQFGEGSIPNAVPDDFPIPQGAVVGAFLVDRVNQRSEVELRVSSEVEVIAQFYGVGLVNSGFVVVDNINEGRRWTITWSRDGVTGVITLSNPGVAGVTQAVIEVDDV